MAYTTAPELNAQKNVYLPAVLEGKNNNDRWPATISAQNFLIVDTEQGPVLQSRPQIYRRTDVTEYPVALTSIRSHHYGSLFGAMFVADNGGGGFSVYGRTAVGAWTLISAAVFGDVFFTNFVTTSGISYIIWGGSGTAGAFNEATGVNTTITTPFTRTGAPVFLDGFLFWARNGTNEIYHSAFDDPFTWPAPNFITANIDGTLIFSLAKLKNRLVAFTRRGIEWFYNAGNTSGSVLASDENFYTRLEIYGFYTNFSDALWFLGGDTTTVNTGKDNKFPFALYSLEDSGKYTVYPLPAEVRNQWTNFITWMCPLTIRENTYFCFPTSKGFANQAGYWFDVRRKVWLYQTVVPSVQIDGGYALLNGGGSNRYPYAFDAFYSGIDFYGQIGIEAPLVCKYTTGLLTHDTLNFKTCNQIKIRVSPNSSGGGSWPPPTTLEYGGAVPNVDRTRTIFNSLSVNTEATRRDFIIRRLGRYRERSYTITFTPNSQATVFYLLHGFEFNLTIGTT